MPLTYPPQSGTAFPTAVGTDDRFFRTDLSREYFYNGTRWLSTTLYFAQMSINLNPLSATTTQWIALPFPEDVDKWLERAQMSFTVASGGTALGGSHNWVGTMTKNGSGGSATAIGGGVVYTINSGASGAWRVYSPITINALIGTTFGSFLLSWVKTGTPGNLTPMWGVTYRLVAA